MSTSVVAHRGDSQAARENTIEAFTRAVEAGVDWVELDLRTTSDGASIVLHDQTLLRLWGLPRRADELTLAQVQRLGTGQCRVPSLGEVVEAVAAANRRLGRTVGLLVDTVDANDALVAARELAAHPLTSGAAPELRVRWCGDTAAMLAVREFDAEAVVAYNHTGGPLPGELLTRLRPATINVEWTLLSGDFVDHVHRMGLDVACWTVDHAEAMTWLLDLGVDAITTNRPRTLVALLAQGTSPLALAWAGADELAARTGIDPEMARWVGVARDLAEWTIAHTRTAPLGRVRTKAHRADVVTEVDTAVEQYVREVIAAHFGDHLVVGEEMGGRAEPGRPTWYLDPVDGTTNLANRLPWTSMSLALAIDHEPVVGVVAQPSTGTIMLAASGLGAVVDGRPVDVRRANGLAGRTVLTELASHEPWPGMAGFVDAMAGQHATCRVMGSGTLALTGVGAGWAAGALVDRFSPIDHLAGVLFSHEAGAIVLDRQGRRTLWPDEGGVLVSCPGVEGALLNAWRAAAN